MSPLYGCFARYSKARVVIVVVWLIAVSGDQFLPLLISRARSFSIKAFSFPPLRTLRTRGFCD